MNNAVTIIVGAGAVLDFDHKGIFPSVKNITDEVLKLSIQKVDGGERPLLRELYDYIVGKLNQVGRPEVNRYIPPQINFESLLHVVEMCISYSSCWHKELTSWPALPEFGTLIQPDEFLNNIQTYDYIRAAYGLQNTVMSIVNQYNASFNEDTSTERWYRDFWKSLSGRSNIFNLNYDNTIENSLGEYDTKQVLQFLQGGAGPGVSAGVLHGARGEARDGARRNAGETGESSRMIDLPHSPQLFVARYELQLPSKEKIRNFLMQENGNTKK